MADNYLEKHYEEYLKRKAVLEKGRAVKTRSNTLSRPQKPDDESL